MSVHEFIPTPEENKEIQRLSRLITLILSLKSAPIHIGISALVDVLLIAYADMATFSNEEDAKAALKALVISMEKTGNLMIEDVYKQQKEKPKASQEVIDSIIRAFKGESNV